MRHVFSDCHVQRKKVLLLGLFLITLASRLLPHPPNFTALLSFAIFTGFFYSRTNSLFYTCMVLVYSDVMLSFYSGFPTWGDWSFFTYTGVMLVAGLSTTSLFKKNTLFCFGTLPLFFWVWANFGVWLTTHLYEKTFSGFLLCLTMALPFLSNQLLGSLGYLFLFWLIYWSFIVDSQQTMSAPIKKVNY